jgi:hypothetical protein
LQGRTVQESAGRVDALQNARLAVNGMSRELRMAGVGVVDKQPLTVQADPYAITFNADLVTTDPADAAAIYYDAGADPLTVHSLPDARRITLPRSAVGYPDSTYFLADGSRSHAETISYWVSPDSTSGRNDQYVLFRRVNDAAPRVVSTGILIPAGRPFFRYFKADTLGPPDSIGTAALPLYHRASVHGAPDDTGRFALPDSIRLVRVRVTGLYRSPQTGDVVRTIDGAIRILNAGLIQRSTCGDAPLGISLTAAFQASPAAGVILRWDAVPDQTGGEKDVERYALFRRPAGTAQWGEPFVSVPANQAAYSYVDQAATSGDWEYGIVALDCTPVSSALSVAPNPVHVP